MLNVIFLWNFLNQNWNFDHILIVFMSTPSWCYTPTGHVIRCTCSSAVASQPITWRQVSAIMYGGMVKTSLNWASQWGNWTWHGYWWQAGLSIWETAVLQGFSWTTTCTVYRDWSKQEKIWKCLVDVRGQGWMERLGWRWQKGNSSSNNHLLQPSMQNTISKRTSRATLEQMDYSSRRAHWLLLLSAII